LPTIMSAGQPRRGGLLSIAVTRQAKIAALAVRQYAPIIELCANLVGQKFVHRNRA